jgi:hypothetical protein
MSLSREEIAERVAGFDIEAADVEAIRAISDLSTWRETVDFDAMAATKDIKAALEVCDRIAETIDRVLGEGAIATIFAGSRVTIIGLGYAFLEVSEAFKAANEAVADQVAEFTETVEED